MWWLKWLELAWMVLMVQMIEMGPIISIDNLRQVSTGLNKLWQVWTSWTSLVKFGPGPGYIRPELGKDTKKLGKRPQEEEEKASPRSVNCRG